MSMKEAFDTFFEEMDNDSLEATGKLPVVPYIKGPASRTLILSETLEDDYAIWRPLLQTEPVSFDKIEKHCGFSIHPQLKEYLSTYWFRDLEAKIVIDDCSIIISLDSLLPGTDANEWLRRMRSTEETHFLSDHNYFLLGTYCNVDGIDSYLVHVNNDTAEVSAVSVGDRDSIKLADSIEDLLNKMKGIWREI